MINNTDLKDNMRGHLDAEADVMIDGHFLDYLSHINTNINHQFAEVEDVEEEIDDQFYYSEHNEQYLD